MEEVASALSKVILWLFKADNKIMEIALKKWEALPIIHVKIVDLLWFKLNCHLTIETLKKLQIK